MRNARQDVTDLVCKLLTDLYALERVVQTADIPAIHRQLVASLIQTTEELSNLPLEY